MSITPSNAEAIAGGAPILLTVTGTWIVGSVSWSVEGPGSVLPVDQFSASYVPPMTVTATSSATVRALSSTGRRALAAITIRPDGLLTVVPPAASVYAGGAPILFSANVIGSAGAVGWSLSGPGTMSVVGALSASYTPPVSVASDATAVLTALLSNPSRAVPANIAVRRPLGNLTVDVSVPAGSGLVPTIRVNGPNGFSRSLGFSQTFSGVLAGIYSVSTRTEIFAGPIATGIYQGTTVGAPATVRPGGASRVNANYRLRQGSGHLWAADSSGMRLRAYAGSQLGTSGSAQASIDIATGPTSFPLSAAMGANGQLWVALDPYTLAGYSSASLVSGSRPPEVILGSGLRGGFLDFTLGLAFDSSGHLWLTSNPPNGGPGFRRLLKYSSQRLTASAPNPVPDLTIRSPAYWYPSALAFDGAGNLWVADSQNHKLLRYNRNQLSQDGMPAPAVTLGNSAPRVPLNLPIDLAFDRGGNLWVGNLGDGSLPGTLIMYTPSQAAAGGVPNPTITIARSGLRGARGMAFDASGGLWCGVNQGLVRYAPSQLLASGEPTPQTVLRDPAMDSPFAVIFNPPSADTPLFR